ncbi:MAG: GspH/FimT family protein [Nitrospira sp.]|nr:GspH/FimT family protein [Nitrospira sp.]
MGVSVPGWLALIAKHRQHATVTEIASELRMARQLAMARHERVRVVVNLEQSELRTECMDCDQRAFRRYEFGRTGTVADSMSTRPEIVFQPSGRSATATTMALLDSRRSCTRHHGESHGMVVEAANRDGEDHEGPVSWSREADSRWSRAWSPWWCSPLA